jgi:hypothetical protein
LGFARWAGDAFPTQLKDNVPSTIDYSWYHYLRHYYLTFNTNKMSKIKETNSTPMAVSITLTVQPTSTIEEAEVSDDDTSGEKITFMSGVLQEVSDFFNNLAALAAKEETE